MTRQAYVSPRSRLIYMMALSAAGLLACASPSSNGTGTGGTTGTGTGGTSHTGGSNGTGTGGSHTGGTTGTGGSNTTGTGGSNTTGTGGSNTTGTGGSHTGGTTGTGGSNTGTGGSNTGTGGAVTTGTGGSNTTGTGGSHTGGTGGSATGVAGSNGTGVGGSSGCSNTDMSSINEDASGYICGNTWGIKGAWYCYSSDTSSPCSPTGVIPWNATSKGMCLSGTINTGGYDGLGFKVNSGPPGSTATPGTWDASKIVGFAITVAPGASGKGSGGSVVEVQFTTPNDIVSTSNPDAPGVTLPGVGSTAVTYNVLFSDAVIANNSMVRKSVDAANLTDVKLTIPSDSQSHSYDFCITKVVPLMAAPSTLVAAGSYGPAWTNQTAQAVNGVNGYTVQNAPFATNGLPMTMQVAATATGVGFTYTAKSGASGNAPAAFPAVVSGWGPGEAGIQLYGPYQADKTISSLQSVTSSWSFSTGSSGDAAFDVWFGPNKAPTTAPAVELMIWISNGGKQPIGYNSNQGAGAAVTGSDGVARTPYVGTNTTGQQVVSYVGTTSSTSITNFDLLKYFNDAASKGYAGMKTSYYLLGVQTGFEVYSADTWKTTDYNISIK